MAVGNGTARRVVTATIARVNGHGFTTVEQPTVWLNVSRYADPPPEIPPAGTSVSITVDGSGFVRAIDRVNSSADELVNGSDQSPAQPTLPLEHELSNAIGKSSPTITRLAVLKAAARLMSGRPDVTPDDVLEVAHVFERWVDGA